MNMDLCKPSASLNWRMDMVVLFQEILVVIIMMLLIGDEGDYYDIAYGDEGDYYDIVVF